MLKTPDLSKEFHPYPKQGKKIKKGKVEKWSDGRAKLKAQFKDYYGITECEAKLPKCTPKNFLGFAHIRRRNDLTDEETVSPQFVILACQNCHEKLDFRMDKKASELFMQTIIDHRG